MNEGGKSYFFQLPKLVFELVFCCILIVIYLFLIP